MQIFFFLLVAVLETVSLVVQAADYLDFNDLINIVEDAKRRDWNDICLNIIEQMDEHLSLNVSETDVPGTPEFEEIIQQYLIMGKESSIFFQKLEYIKIFTECSMAGKLETLPFEYYAHMILMEPTKRIDESDLLKSEAISTLAAIDDIQDYVSKRIFNHAYELEGRINSRNRCRSFAVNIERKLSGDLAPAASDEKLIEILEKAKSTAIHLRDPVKMYDLATCLKIYGKLTLDSQFYNRLSSDLTEIVPESLFDIYDGVLDYDYETFEGLDINPTINQIAIAIDDYNRDDPIRCLYLGVKLFRLVYPAQECDIDDPLFYRKLIKLIKNSRIIWMSTWRRRGDVIFKDCIESLVEMHDSVSIDREEMYYSD